MSYDVSDIAERLNLNVLAGRGGLDKKVEGVYVGDLLSWVMGNAKENSAWITIQGHVNIVAVALLTNVSCIIVAESADVSQQTIEKADLEDIPVLFSGQTAYELAKAFAKLEEGGL